MDATAEIITAHRAVDPVAHGPIAYEIAVYDHGGGALSAEVYTNHDDLIASIADEGQFRADRDLLEVIERRADGTVIRHERDTIDAWCAERDRDIALDRQHEWGLRARRAA